MVVVVVVVMVVHAKGVVVCLVVCLFACLLACLLCLFCLVWSLWFVLLLFVCLLPSSGDNDNHPYLRKGRMVAQNIYI